MPIDALLLEVLIFCQYMAVLDLLEASSSQKLSEPKLAEPCTGKDLGADENRGPLSRMPIRTPIR